ncbi:major tail protein [Allofournierella sp.]|uniref:major tail protein n=1 Tax=Allofournierella sp. TaxID=1940256 RepID=UPI003AF1E1DE
MASFGAKYPCFALIKSENASALPTYEKPVTIGRLVKADLTVQMASGKLHADDILAESVDEFVSASIAMETDDMADDVASEVYGATVTGKEVSYKAGDAAPMGGLAYYKVLMRNGVKLYKGYYYPKVKAVLGNDSAATKADTITFGTSSTTFTVFACKTDEWRITEELESDTAAQEWVDAKLAPPANSPAPTNASE